MVSAEYLEHFQMRVIQDAISSAHAEQLIRRAEQFEAARPKPGDFHGQATRDELSRRWRELTSIADALRAKAELVGGRAPHRDAESWEAA